MKNIIFHDKYCLTTIKYNSIKIPVLFDKNILKTIKKCTNIASDNFCNIMSIDNGKSELIKNIIMKTDSDVKNINEIGFDLRKVNLVIMKKKNPMIDNKQIILPEHMYYQQNKNRIMIKIKDYTWFSTSKKNIVLTDKITDAIVHLNKLRKQMSELFEHTQLNDNNIVTKKALADEYFKIIKKYGFDNIKKIKYDLNGNIKKHTNKTGNKNIKNTIKTTNKLPKYVYYRKQYKNRGSFYYIENHPNSTKIFRTTSSKKISDKDKYDQIITWLNQH
jgi:hypothetical protein